jgi:exopolysaccharide biosynthesis polyprenyl glycosylphosphotransferase
VNLVVGYLIVFLSLLVVHIPLVLRLGAGSLRQAAEILRAEMVSSHLGHLVLYGALVALLSYTEGLFDDAAACRWYEYSLIAGKIVFWTSLVLGVGLRLCGKAMDAPTLLSLAIIIGMGLAAVKALSRGAQTGTVGGFKQSRNVLIVGPTAAAARVAKHLASPQQCRRVIKGIISRSDGNNALLVGRVNELLRIARAKFVDEIIVVCGSDRELAERAITEAVRNHLDVSIVPDLFIDSPSGLSMQMLEGMPLISVHRESIPWLGLLMKRVMDVAMSTLALLLLAPVMAIIAIAIKCESRGPALYSALRVGKKGHAFRCYKFRTMCQDADRAKDLLRAHNERQGPTFKIVNDPRITPLGRILRRYSLDELPQLWNVLTGTMSLVGPRPHPMDDYQRYALEDRRRLDVAPGITGLWQVTAREDSSFSTNMALDLEYIENWSLRNDLAIVLKTVPAVLTGTGA